ncbi:PREDICTED: serine/threonine-protein kinase Chk2-like, partial [Amphimedon queenslandica]|uniref:Serine/threonine-protein kinase Chk2 n=1 Tax=Amphimedon queenslandica TaxID=400682 RepID=A0AAN0JRJ5_AMPQE
EEQSLEIWGRFFPLPRAGLTGIDFLDDEYIFGRSEDCDYCFERRGGTSNQHYPTYSSTHFRIYRERSKTDSNQFVVFLQDKSSNGTFINGDKIGKNKTHILNNDDEISLSVKNNKVFVFNDRSVSEQNNNLPEEFKDKYTMSKQIGKGACGIVKLAFHRETCKGYAIKIISKKMFSVGPHLGRAAMEEVKIIKALQHPCIIRVEDLYESTDSLYIVLELVEGGELFDRVILNGKFNDKVGKLLFYQMVVAVKYLHDKGITHRDLKPENILLSSTDEETLIKVTDFGLSKFVGEQSLMKTLCGTPSYLAPEVIKSAGLGGYSKAVDCWSLGVILYIMLGGYPPFSDEIREHSLHDQICQGIYSFPPAYWNGVSKDGNPMLLHLCFKQSLDSSKRWTTAQALEHTWLKDEDMRRKAHQMMVETADKHQMPPPSLPGSKRILNDENNNNGDSKRPHLEGTPSPSDDTISIDTEPIARDQSFTSNPDTNNS